jgi:hypothetical protein
VIAIFGEQDGRFSLNEMIQRKAALLSLLPLRPGELGELWFPARSGT